MPRFAMALKSKLLLVTAGRQCNLVSRSQTNNLNIRSLFLFCNYYYLY
jgi:hypothetical protein